MLVRREPGGLKVVVPDELKLTVLHTYHDLPVYGHRGITSTTRRLAKHFWWRGMAADVRSYVKTCTGCQFGKTKRLARHLPPSKIIALHPNHIHQIDLIGPIDPSSHGCKYILTWVDHATGMMDLKGLKRAKTGPILQWLEQEVWTRGGYPEVLMTDKGSQFRSTAFKGFCRSRGIRRVPGPGYRPQTTGKVERVNGLIKETLRVLVQNRPKTWATLLHYVRMAINSAITTLTQLSAADLWYGRALSMPTDTLVRELNRLQADAGSTEEDVEVALVADLLPRLKEACDRTLRTAEQLQAEATRLYNDANKRAIQQYAVGDQVLIYAPMLRKGLDSGLRGPYRIVKRIGHSRYVVELDHEYAEARALELPEPEPQQRFYRPRAQFVVSAERLYPFYAPMPLPSNRKRAQPPAPVPSG